MTRFAVAFLILAALPCNLMAAEPARRGTPDEQRACERDATRLCSQQIPDDFAVLACLKRHREKLHKACRAVLEAHGQ